MVHVFVVFVDYISCMYTTVTIETVKIPFGVSHGNKSCMLIDAIITMY